MGFVEGGIKWKYLHFHFLHSLFIEITRAYFTETFISKPSQQFLL